MQWCPPGLYRENNNIMPVADVLAPNRSQQAACCLDFDYDVTGFLLCKIDIALQVQQKGFYRSTTR